MKELFVIVLVVVTLVVVAVVTSFGRVDLSTTRLLIICGMAIVTLRVWFLALSVTIGDYREYNKVNPNIMKGDVTSMAIHGGLMVLFLVFITII